MTIIQNKIQKTNGNPKILISSLIVILIMLSISGIFVYNQTVNINHNIEKEKIVLRDAEVKNAELKNNIYGMFSQEKTLAVVTNSALVVEKNPKYLKIQQTASLDISKEIGLAR